MNLRIKDLREDNDLTQKELAAILEMSQTGYSKYETGETQIPVSVLVRLSLLYNRKVDYLLGITDDHSPAYLNEESRERLEQYRILLQQVKADKAGKKKGSGHARKKAAPPEARKKELPQ